MQDDRGRLILRIDNASLSDAGNYRCHGEANSQDTFLSVHPVEHFAINRSSGLPAVPLAAGMIKFFKMFPSDRASEVILYCPLTPAQRVLAWEWREPIPPDSDLAAVLPRDAIPSRTVSFNETGIFSNDNVEIGPGLAWVRILDPFSPEAPNKLWCKFEMQDLWHNKKGHPSYYEIHWTLYEPINVKVKLHNSSTEPLFYDQETRNGGFSSGSGVVDYSAVYGSLGLERERSSHRDRMALLAEPQPRLIEGYPARLACIYRPIHGGQTAGRPVQIAAWFRGDDFRSIPQPPFHVNNTQEEGVSWLTVRAFPIYPAEEGVTSPLELASQVPYEKITCVVNSLIDEENNYTVNSNASLVLEVIRQPRIVEINKMSAEVSLGDFVKVTCVALANGKPNISIDFSATAGRRPCGSTLDNRQEQHREALETGSPEDVQMAGWRSLVESYRLKLYRSPVDPSRPMLHKLVVDIRGALREHHGTYRCRVTNAAGQAQHVGHLRVRSEPKLTIQPQQSTYFLARQPLSISCLVSGYPLAGTNLSTLRSASTDEAGVSTVPAVEVLESTEEEATVHQQQLKQQKTNRLLQEAERVSPVRLVILKANRRREPLVSVKLADLRVGVYEGINATYSVLINHRPQGEIVARCEYVHTDGSMASDEIQIKQATPPAPPKIVALCSGPGAVIFGVTNPLVSAENEATDRIVNQRVLFAPTAEFHSASNLASKIIILDKNGQPRSEKTVDGDEEEIQEALLAGELNQQQQHQSGQQSLERPILSTIPLTNLLPGTNYTFEWSSANQFHLTTTIQFVTATAPLTAPSKPTHFVFLVPTSSYLRISVFLDDPCPYDNGGRAELNNILIRYRKAAHQLGQGYGEKRKLLGYGNWSKTLVCFQNQMKDPGDIQLQQHQSIKWSGDAVIQCDVRVEDPHADLEVAVATMNRFGVSPWLSSIYRASEALHAAYFYTTGTTHPIVALAATCVVLILQLFVQI
ncbi:hypothetical protein TcWFU_002710 [Taenia crassiceps]|uniref:Ig-like domain-containing protein n=1 Tax=Taenia crassiceps TaxID=6207 RepID=A0ABR4Q3S5_9CEST